MEHGHETHIEGSEAQCRAAASQSASAGAHAAGAHNWASQISKTTRMVNQRRQIDSIFGGVTQRRVANAEKPVQPKSPVIQRRLDGGAAFALFQYYLANYEADITRKDYLDDVHKTIVLNTDSLEQAKDELDAKVSELRGIETRGEGRAPKGFAPVFMGERAIDKANKKRKDERKNLFCIVSFDDKGVTDYESGKSRRGPKSLRFNSADAEQRMVEDFPNLLSDYGAIPRSVTIITSASPCNAVCLPLLIQMIHRYAGQILSWDISFFEPYYGEELDQFVNTIHSLNIVTAGSNGQVTVSRAGLLPRSDIESGSVSQNGEKGRQQALVKLDEKRQVITD